MLNQNKHTYCTYYFTHTSLLNLKTHIHTLPNASTHINTYTTTQSFQKVRYIVLWLSMPKRICTVFLHICNSTFRKALSHVPLIKHSHTHTYTHFLTCSQVPLVHLHFDQILPPTTIESRHYPRPDHALTWASPWPLSLPAGPLAQSWSGSCHAAFCGLGRVQSSNECLCIYRLYPYIFFGVCIFEVLFQKISHLIQCNNT